MQPARTVRPGHTPGAHLGWAAGRTELGAALYALFSLPEGVHVGWVECGGAEALSCTEGGRCPGKGEKGSGCEHRDLANSQHADFSLKETGMQLAMQVRASRVLRVAVTAVPLPAAALRPLEVTGPWETDWTVREDAPEAYPTGL